MSDSQVVSDEFQVRQEIENETARGPGKAKCPFFNPPPPVALAGRSRKPSPIAWSLPNHKNKSSGHSRAACKTASIRTSFFSTRYATIKGVPRITNSRVPDTRPLRPANGWRARMPTESQMWLTISVAADSLSAAMYSKADASCWVAGALHQRNIASDYFVRPILLIIFFTSACETSFPSLAARRPFLISLMWYSFSSR